MVEGNTQHRYKDAITMLEESSPGTKHQMYFGFLKKAAARFAEDSEEGRVTACASCGAPTMQWTDEAPVCAFCKTKALAEKRRAEGGPRRRSHPRRRQR